MQLIEEFTELDNKDRKRIFVKILTKYGLCVMTKHDWNSKGFKPNIKSALNQNEYFIAECNEVHNNKYSYSETVYVNAHSFIKIICPNHGMFEQKAYSHKSGIGCKLCSTNNDQKEIETILLKNGFNIEDYKSTAIIVSNEYGQYKTTASRIRNKIFPTIESAIDKTQVFINMANTVHNNRYTYLKAKYIGSNEQVTITCPMHGDFEQKPNNHILNKQNCPFCSNLNYQYYKNLNDDLDILKINLYILKCNNDHESFYKIGITSKTVEVRFKYEYGFSYTYEILDLYSDFANNICRLEKYLHSKFKGFKYTPLNDFHGMTECFSEIPNYQQSIKDFYHDIQNQSVIPC